MSWYLQPRRADLDMNQHVNNVTYIGWVLEVGRCVLLFLMVVSFLFICTLLCLSADSCKFSSWQSIPQEIIDNYELQTITLDYRRECQQDDVVDSLTSVEPDEDGEIISKLQGTNGSPITTEYKQDCRQFLHLLRLAGDGLEINRGRTEWRKKKPARRWKDN